MGTAQLTGPLLPVIIGPFARAGAFLYAIYHLLDIIPIQEILYKILLFAPYISVRPSKALFRVASSVNSRFEPTGIP